MSTLTAFCLGALTGWAVFALIVFIGLLLLASGGQAQDEEVR